MFVLEDFATDIELSEEEQIRLLQQYEEETKQKKPTQTNKKEVVGEKVLFQKASPTKTKNQSKEQGEETRLLEKSKDKLDELTNDMNEDHFNERNLNKKVAELKISKTGSSNSLDLETKSSNSSDGDWEKISDSDK